MSTMQLSRSLRLFQERRIPQDRMTMRLPGPRLDMQQNLVHSIPLTAPYPLPAVLAIEQRSTPDTGHTGIWPWPAGSVTLTGNTTS